MRSDYNSNAMTKYPIGLQNFKGLREDGYLYIDKTKYVYELATSGKYYFLSRPRRFGKSLLISTIEAYFQGQKELFKGLALEQLEKEWKVYPVFHLDLNAEQYTSPEGLLSILDRYLRMWERQYGKNEGDKTPTDRFVTLIQRAYEQTGHKVVILVDEYDKKGYISFARTGDISVLFYEWCMSLLLKGHLIGCPLCCLLRHYRK